MNESGNDTNPPYCYCAAGVFAGRVRLVVERDCNKFTEKKDKNPVLVKCRDCKYRGTISHYRDDDFAGCKIRAESRSMRYGTSMGTGVDINVERECAGFEKREPEKPELVKCRDCRYCLPPENIGNFHCNVAPAIDIRSITVDELHGCDDFVKREPEKSEPEKREPETGPDKKSCHTCNACVKDTWGTSCKKGLLTFCPDNEYCQWEPVPEKEPEKEPETEVREIEWKWEADCQDCEHLTGLYNVCGEMRCEKGGVVKSPNIRVLERPCVWYKKKWEWEADCGQCRFRHETTHHDAHGECLMCEKGNIVKDNHPEGSTVLYNSYKDCPDYEKEWAWQADCGDCIYIKTITEEVKGTQKGRIAACKIPHVGGYCVKCVEVPPDYWYRIQRVDFHDCEGYTAPEPEKPNPVELKCDTCIHYPVQSDPKRVILCGEVCGADHEAYIPRSCGNCGHRPPNSVTNVCMYCTLRNMFIGGHETFLINQEYCDEWIPKSEEPAKSCETCGNRKPHEFGVGGTCCSVAEYPRCNEDRSWRSWTPISTPKQEKEHIPYWKQLNILVREGEKVTYQCPCGNVINVEGFEKQKDKEVTEMNEKNEQDEKSNEKFPFTCPECGSDDIPFNAYHCPHCGVLLKPHLTGIIPSRVKNDEKNGKTEKTRKAVRVRKYTPGSPESRAVSSSIAIAKILLQLGIVWFFGTITVSASINEIIKHFLAAVIGLGTFTTIAGFIGIPCLELVDVPRVPAIDRLRAWKQARKDTRMAELERENEILCGDNKLAEVNLRGQEMITEEWKQTAANLTKQHEQDIKDITEERDAMVNTILTDRDANWIPKSNRLKFKPISASFSREEDSYQPVYINAMGLSPIFKNFVNIEAEINGDTAKAIMDGNFVAFSTDVLKDVLKDGEN
jgi:hypothetical protein